MCLLGFGFLVKTQKAMIRRPYLKPKPKTHVLSASETKQATKLISCFSIIPHIRVNSFWMSYDLVRKGICRANKKKSVALKLYSLFLIWIRKIVAYLVLTVFDVIYENKITWPLKMMTSSNVNEKKTSYSCLSKMSINTLSK